VGLFMKHKSQVFQHFLSFKAMVEKEKGVNIKCLRSDGGGECYPYLVIGDLIS